MAGNVRYLESNLHRIRTNPKLVYSQKENKMFTVLSNTRKTNLYLIVALAIALVVILGLAVVPSIAAPKAAVIPVTGIAESPDYYQRHPELSVPAEIPAAEMSDYFQRHNTQSIEIPVTGLSASPDYFQRHPELNAPAGVGIAVDMSDYFLRHPALPTEDTDLSDYFLRH